MAARSKPLPSTEHPGAVARMGHSGWPRRLPRAEGVAVIGPVGDQAGLRRVRPGFPQGPSLGAVVPPVTRRYRGTSRGREPTLLGTRRPHLPAHRTMLSRNASDRSGSSGL